VKVLLVDDIRVMEAAGGDEVTVARTAAEGLKLLQEQSWDLLLLDHDLGDSGDIRPLVRFLEERAFLGPKVPIGMVVVVSSNPPGASWVARGLERHYQLALRPAGPSIRVESLGLPRFKLDRSDG